MPKQELSLEIFGADTNQLVLPHPEIAQIFVSDVQAALASARIIRRMFYGIPLSQLHVEFKKDETPKTIADTEGDFAIYRTIRKLRPHDEMMLEETGYHKALADLHPTTTTTIRHYADSLDGSRPFIEEKPWSTVGVGTVEQNGDYLTGVIVHPFRQSMGVAVRGMGAYLLPLNARLLPNGKPQELHVSQKDTLTGGTVSIDSLFPTNNPEMRRMKHTLMSRLEDMGVTSFDMVGSNIAYQLDVAAGRSVLGFTDAVGGPWDWRIGEALINEAGGVMLDVLTGKKPTDKSEALVYGNRVVVDQILPHVHGIYWGFRGFNPK